MVSEFPSVVWEPLDGVHFVPWRRDFDFLDGMAQEHSTDREDRQFVWNPNDALSRLGATAAHGAYLERRVETLMSDLQSSAAIDEGDSPKRRLRVFRATDSVQVTTDTMPLDNVSETDAMAMSGAEEQDGAFVKVLFADQAAGMSIAYSWFKPNFILPKHSHNADCVYYIISGEAHLGSQVLRAGDGFFVPAGGNYQYSAGSEGVEVMEFRTAAEFNMRFSGNTEADWQRIMDAAMTNHQGWLSAAPPLAAARMMG